MHSDRENITKREKKRFGNKPGIAFFHFVIRFAGPKTAYLFLYVIVFFYSVLFPSVKKTTDPYLSRRFPRAGFFAKIKHRYWLIMNFGRVLIDKTAIGVMDKDIIRASFKDPNDITKIRAIDSGFILLISHVGCWQVAMSALDILQKPVNLVMLTDEKDINKHFFEYQKKKNVLKIINPEQFLGGTIEMVNVLKNDEILCIMGDRIFKNEELSVKVDFLNGKALFPITAFKLSSVCQKPIVILNSYISGPSEYELEISNIIQVSKKAGKTKDGLRPYVLAFVDSLETFIKTHPYQFFNFFDMWLDKPFDGKPEGEISSDIQ